MTHGSQHHFPHPLAWSVTLFDQYDAVKVTFRDCIALAVRRSGHVLLGRKPECLCEAWAAVRNDENHHVASKGDHMEEQQIRDGRKSSEATWQHTGPVPNPENHEKYAAEERLPALPHPTHPS